ncbi:kelch-like protein 30 [Euwallacea fornicatus]|uniref:kelch-like protein 30 n=1 Tax=Euwallacea fornicatus TaxID=995702 RepID=UPI00338F86AA
MVNPRTDVVLEIEGTPVTCNRELLINNSDYFFAMLTGTFRESSLDRIEIKGVKLTAFNTVLLLLCDNTHVIDDEELHIILETACMLQFESVKLMCESRIQQVLKPSICLNIWQTAEMLHLSPLYLKAKYMALGDFPHICDSHKIFYLTLKEICLYLGHIYLNAKNEMTVFQTAINWWYENQEHYAEECSTQVLLQLLNCLDFQKFKDTDIRDMQSYPDIADNEELQAILNCVIDLRSKGINVGPNFSEEQMSFAIHLCNSKARQVPEMPSLLLQRCIENMHTTHWPNGKEWTDKSFVMHDPVTNTFKEFFLIRGNKIRDLVGFKLHSYKEFTYFFGGQFLINGSQWNFNLWTYDSFKEKWERKNKLPHKRRHFDSVMVEGCIFIVGGVANFRVVQDTMLWYDCEADKWADPIPLPHSERFFRCCSFLGKLCLVYFRQKRAYLFDKAEVKWTTIDIQFYHTFFEEMRNFEVFSVSNYLYIKGKYLIKLKYVAEALIIVNHSQCTDFEYEESQSILCNNVHYTLYTCRDEQYNVCHTLEMMDLESGRMEYLFENKIQEKDVAAEADRKLFCTFPSTRLFSVGYYWMVKDNNCVNEPIVR